MGLPGADVYTLGQWLGGRTFDDEAWLGGRLLSGRGVGGAVWQNLAKGVTSGMLVLRMEAGKASVLSVVNELVDDAPSGGGA